MLSLRRLTAVLFVAASALPGGAVAAEEPRAPAVTAPRPKEGSPPEHPGLPEPTQPPQAVIVVKDGRLTVRVQNQSLERVLDDVSRKARVAIARGAGVGDERLSLDLRDVPLDEGLRRILNQYDAFFFYTPGTKTPASLSAVWVYPKGHARRFAPVPPEAWASTKEMREEARTSPDPKARSQAVETLVERQRERALDVVLEALKDADAQVRSRALYGATNAGLRIPANVLTQLLTTDPSPDVRFLALEGLAADRDLLPAITLRELAARALNDPSWQVQVKAFEILQRLEPPPPGRPRQPLPDQRQAPGR